MESFIAEVGPASVCETKENLTHLKEVIVEQIAKGLTILNDDDEASNWFFYGVGGPA